MAGGSAMAGAWQSLVAEVDILLERHSRVAETALHAAERLQAGLVVDGGLDDELRALSEGRAELALRVAGALGIEVNELPAALNRWRVALNEQSARAEALAILVRVQRFRHTDEASYAPLEAARAQARTLAEALAQSDAAGTVAQLAGGEHPLAKLDLLTTAPDGLDDPEWDAAHAAIAAAFSPELSRAVLRRRIVPSGPPTSPPAPATARLDGLGGPASGPGEVSSEKDAPARGLGAEAEAEAEPEPVPSGIFGIAPLAAAVDTPVHGDGVLEPAELTDSVAAPEPAPDQAQARPAVEGADAQGSPAARSSLAPAVGAADGPANRHTATDPQNPAARPSEPVKVAEPSKPEVRPNDVTRPRSSLEPVFWNALGAGRTGLAFHLAQVAEALDLAEALPPAALVKALALSPHLHSADGSVATAMAAAYQEVGEVGDDRATHLIAWAAALRSSVMAPETGATAILRTVHWGDGTDRLYALTRGVLSFGERSHGLDPTVLQGAKGQAAWQAEVDGVRQAAVDMAAQAPHQSLLGPSTAVWRAWNRPGREIHQLLEPVRTGDASRAQDVRERVARLVDRTAFHKLVHDTDARELNRRSGEAIHARALRLLETHRDEAVRIARRWLRLIEESPEHSDYVRGQAEPLRREIDQLYAGARQQLASCDGDAQDLNLRVAARQAIRALDDLKALFAPASSIPTAEAALPQVLNAELLLCAQVDMDEQWEPECPAAMLLPQLVGVAEGPPDWVDAFDARLARHDLQGAARIQAHLESMGDPVAAEFGTRLALYLETEAAALQRDLNATRNEVELALAYGFISDWERADYDARMNDCERRTGEGHRFHEAFAILAAIRQAIAERTQDKTREALAELERLPLDRSSGSYRRIQAVIESRDLLSANDYFERIKAGSPLPEPPEPHRDPFAEFFPARLRSIDIWFQEQFAAHSEVAAADSSRLLPRSGGERNGIGASVTLASPSPSPQHPGDALVRLLRGGSDFAGLELRRIPVPQLSASADAVRLWLNIKRTQKVKADEARQLLRWLGFDVQVARLTKSERPTEVHVETTPLTDRDLCPVPSFGSQAEGRYTVFCVWERPGEEELINLVGETAQRQHPVLILYFGRLGEKRRRELARLCRDRRRSFVVLDDTLLVFLCAEPGPRLPAFFRCALPFTFAEPYVTTAGLVPPEMFYGRRIELDAVRDFRSVQSFVYGGRQLGKTALLREAQRSFHDPAKGRLAVWIDLKAEAIGQARGPEEVWRSIHRELGRLEIVPGLPDPNPGVRGRIERFAQVLEEWVAADPDRRILLLLDEADPFLEQDGTRDFAESRRLKNLMDRTSRRLKVVFAGLHNVLRTTERSNHPLAHLGDPVNIGPLMHHREWNEARALIVRPLQALGYQFEREDLPTRILAQTNYYPSLIQLYCAQLLRQMTGARVDQRSGPPYVITERHIDEAYATRDLRDAVRDRFHLTLQLDPRYEVITYLIADAFVNNAASAAEGMPIAEIRMGATEKGPKVFAGTSDREFGVLLEEMEGLGVLRRVNGSRFTLRNQNLLLLMGTPQEIRQNLARDREAAPQFALSTFHARRRDPDILERHPLTHQQEGELHAARHGTTAVLGTSAASIEQLVPFLKERNEISDLHVLNKISDAVSFERELGRILKAKAESGTTTTVVVPDHVHWSNRWLTVATAALSTLRPKGPCFRLLFIGHPHTAWSLHRAGAQLEADGIEWIALRPWHDDFVRQWLEDVGLPNRRDARERIRTATGNWSRFLIELREAATDHNRWEQCLEEIERRRREPEQAERVLQAFGLDLAEPRETLRAVAQYAGADGEIDLDEVADLAEVLEVPPDRLRRSLDWAELVGLAVPVGPGGLRLDQVVLRVLGS